MIQRQRKGADGDRGPVSKQSGPREREGKTETTFRKRKGKKKMGLGPLRLARSAVENKSD